MIILGGVNKFPTDIEAEVADAAPELLRPGCAAAFAVPLDPEGQEIILVTEVRDAKDVRVTDAAARRALAEELACGVWDATEVPLSSIVFIPPRSICKTTSGKVQRRLCASLLASQSKDLPILWREDSLETPVGKHILRSQVQAALAETEHSDELAAHIEEIISEVLGATLAAAAPGEGATLAQRGLDSIQLMRASSLIKQRLGISIGLTDVGSLQDAQSLAVHVRKHCAAGGALALDADAPKTIVPDPAARYEPFPLMDMQSAYLFGRTAAVDGLAPIGCQVRYCPLLAPGPTCLTIRIADLRGDRAYRPAARRALPDCAAQPRAETRCPARSVRSGHSDAACPARSARCADRGARPRRHGRPRGAECRSAEHPRGDVLANSAG
jgi:acyl carrier protein